MFRRRFLLLIPASGLLAAIPQLAVAQDEEDVTPTEDLMREHGLLKRVLLIYDEIRVRIAAKASFPPEAVTNSGNIIRSFIEQYHEKLEEDHLFPRFRKRNKLVDLVDTLDAQHKAGRRVTERILTLARAGLKSDADRQALSISLHQFVRMYAPHEAREDTVLFPAFRELVSKNEYAALGEDFEKREHQLFGKEGFEGMVEKVGAIEKTLGIDDLKQFTPRV
jgi:hemerythrin-like domain-containing protein